MLKIKVAILIGVIVCAHAYAAEASEKSKSYLSNALTGSWQTTTSEPKAVLISDGATKGRWILLQSEAGTSLVIPGVRLIIDKQELKPNHPVTTPSSVLIYAHQLTLVQQSDAARIRGAFTILDTDMLSTPQNRTFEWTLSSDTGGQTITPFTVTRLDAVRDILFTYSGTTGSQMECSTKLKLIADNVPLPDTSTIPLVPLTSIIVRAQTLQVSPSGRCAAQIKGTYTIIDSLGAPLDEK